MQNLKPYIRAIYDRMIVPVMLILSHAAERETAVCPVPRLVIDWFLCHFARLATERLDIEMINKRKRLLPSRMLAQTGVIPTTICAPIRESESSTQERLIKGRLIGLIRINLLRCTERDGRIERFYQVIQNATRID